MYKTHIPFKDGEVVAVWMDRWSQTIFGAPAGNL
jgi:hypothetical protein